MALPQLVNTGFQVLFHSPPGVLFTFPSQYYALSVTKEYLALRGGPRSFPQGFPCLVVLWILLRCSVFRLRGSHPLWLAFPKPFHYTKQSRPQSEPQHARTLVWALPFSLAATLGIDVSFSSSGYLDVSVHRVPFHTLWIHVWIHEVCSCGFPHSEISGSMGICPSPKLFAAYHVLHRLLVPRHPPCALSCLTFSSARHSYSVRNALLLVFLSHCDGLFAIWFDSSAFAESSDVFSYLNVSFRYLVCVCSFQSTCFRLLSADGLKWTRTTDLTLIRRAL